MHGSPMRNESLQRPVAGKKPLEFHLLASCCLCPDLEPSRWRTCFTSGARLASGAPLALLTNLPITTVITSLRGNEVTTVTGITSEKQGLKTIPDEGWIRNSRKLCISLQVATIHRLKGFIWLVVPYAAPGGLKKDLARSRTRRVLTG